MKQKKQRSTLLAPFIILIILAASLTMIFWVCFQMRNHVPLRRVNHPIASDPMADWQTYTNNNLGFSLKLPQQWRTQDYGNSIYLVSPENVYPYPKYQYNTAAINLSRYAGKPRIADLKNVSDLSINGVTGTSGVELILPYTKHVILHGTTNDIIVSWPVLIHEDGTVVDENDIYNQILSTFKFTDDAADWKTYNDKDGGYTIKYPSTWRVSDFDPQFVNIIPPSEDVPNKETYVSSIRLEYFPKPLVSNNGSIVGRDEAVFTLQDRKEITVNGTKATQGIKNGIPNLFVTQIATADKTYQIYWPTVNGYSETFQQILSTFKFADDMSDWQTYTNSNLHFSFKYPADWHISNDTLPTILPADAQRVDQSLSFLSESGDKHLMFFVNPPAFGPFFNQKNILIKQTTKGLNILSEQDNNVEENLDSKTYAVGVSEDSMDQPSYWMNFSAPIAEKDELLTTIKNIITSFSFTK
ncbi:MAG: hypothetical protein V1846_00295 [Candidatus Komeilibacteria bacterium]